MTTVLMMIWIAMYGPNPHDWPDITHGVNIFDKTPYCQQGTVTSGPCLKVLKVEKEHNVRATVRKSTTVQSERQQSTPAQATTKVSDEEQEIDDIIREIADEE